MHRLRSKTCSMWLGLAPILAALGGQSVECSAHAETSEHKKLSYGAASGTLFWVGPAYQVDKPLHYGTAHPRDWTGIPDTEYLALEDVVLTAVPLNRTPNAARKHSEATFARSAGRDTWPRDPVAVIECYSGIPCTRVIVVQGGTFIIHNYQPQALSLLLTQNAQTITEIEAPPNGAETTISVGIVAPGVYILRERISKRIVTWIYRAKPEDTIAGPTNDNCRYSISLAPGKYLVTAWHPYLSSISQAVDVRAGLISRLNIVFSGKDLTP